MKVNKSFVGLVALAALVMLISLACGITDNLVNKVVGDDANYTSVPSLWPDVPQMDRTSLSELEQMPPFVKLAMRLVLGNLGKLNPEGSDQTTGKVDWIVYTTDKTAQDVQNFYTNELMTSNGWDENQTPCISGSDQTTTSQVAATCIYQKTQNGQLVQLLIMSGVDEQTKKTNVFYLRLESFGTPEAPATP